MHCPARPSWRQVGYVKLREGRWFDQQEEKIKSLQHELTTGETLTLISLLDTVMLLLIFD